METRDVSLHTGVTGLKPVNIYSKVNKENDKDPENPWN